METISPLDARIVLTMRADFSYPRGGGRGRRKATMAEEKVPKGAPVTPGPGVVELKSVAPLSDAELLQLRVSALNEALEASKGSAAIWRETAQQLQREVIPDLQKSLGAAYAQIRDLVKAVGDLIGQLQVQGNESQGLDPQQLLHALNQLKMAHAARKAQKAQQPAPQGQGGGQNGR